MKVKKLFIFGNTRYASMIKDYFQIFSEYEVVGFVVDAKYITEDVLDGLPVVAAEKCMDVYPVDEYYAFVAIGYTSVNRIREEKSNMLREQGYRFATYIDPSVRCFPDAVIGDNCFIMEQVVIHPKAVINNNVCIWSNVYIGHDVVVEDNVLISVGAVVSGGCSVGKNSFIGVNATINNDIKIADYTVVGAGAHIGKNTSMYGVYRCDNTKNIIKKLVSDEVDAAQAQMLFFNGNI